MFQHDGPTDWIAKKGLRLAGILFSLNGLRKLPFQDLFEGGLSSEGTVALVTISTLYSTSF
jgi:hypothetical protein